VKALLYDPTGDKAREVKARYQGVCRGCGTPTAPRNGKGDAYAYCKRCHPGAIARQWTRERVREAMRAWRARYGAAPSSYDWSRTHTRRRGGEALKRLALAAGEWPASSTVIDSVRELGGGPRRCLRRRLNGLGVNAADIRTRARAPARNREPPKVAARGFCHLRPKKSSRTSTLVVCRRPSVVARAQFGEGRRTRPLVRRDCRNRGEAITPTLTRSRSHSAGAPSGACGDRASTGASARWRAVGVAESGASLRLSGRSTRCGRQGSRARGCLA